MNSTKQKGFTIVELLIVMVIIGILASIVVVAYNGVTAKARNTAVVSVASDWVQLLNGYASLNGIQLSHDGYTPVCLGSTENYPATAEFDEGVCVGDWGTVDEDANDALKEYARINQTWTTGVAVDNFWGEATRGIQYAHNGILGSTNHQWITYSLDGDVDCGLSGATKTFDNGVTTCEVDVDLWID